MKNTILNIKKIDPLQQAPFSLEYPTPPSLLMDSIPLAKLLKDFYKDIKNEQNSKNRRCMSDL